MNQVQCVWVTHLFVRQMTHEFVRQIMLRVSMRQASCSASEQVMSHK